jgi:hypothetical protein
VSSGAGAAVRRVRVIWSCFTVASLVGLDTAGIGRVTSNEKGSSPNE